jgi:DtxR family Mn-dependent transcriptional regulator
MEDYLEAVLSVQREKPVARVGEIAGRLGVSNPTVTAALRTLAEGGFIEHESYGYVQLTPKGRRAAEAVDRRHRLLGGFLRDVLGVPAERAGEEACRIEHHIARDTVERLTRFVEFVENCPRCQPPWREHLLCYCAGGPQEGQAQQCAAECVDRCLEALKAECEGLCARS